MASNTSKPQSHNRPTTTRRQIIKSATLGSLAAMTGSLSSPFAWSARASTVSDKPFRLPPEGNIAWSACAVNCGSRCALRMHVVDGVIKWVETDNTGNDLYGDHQVRACLRGRSIRRRINHPDRLKYPMKRVGKRGEGKFERISWDEALDTIAKSLNKTVETYGNESVYIQYCTGLTGGNITRSSPSYSLVARLMNCYGGFLNQYGTYSNAQIAEGFKYTYADGGAGNSPSDLANTKLLVMFGNNPAETRMSGGGVVYNMTEALARSHARVIVIDPRYTDTAGGREDEWIPIRPGTDAALVSAIAHVLITENMVDQEFLDKYCVGYDEKTLPEGAAPNGHYKAHILGEGPDGIAKTPEWASPITGIPVDRIVKLAREIGTTKPCCIQQGWGPQRHANGEIVSRAIAMLAILTGNVGIRGGNTGGRENNYVMPFGAMPLGTNPVKTSIPMFLWTDAIIRGPEMTAKRDGIRGVEKLRVPIKFIWNYAGNTLVNQHSEINRTKEILADDTKCEMIVVVENFMTSSAKYADILLPDAVTAEQMDLLRNTYGGDMGYVIFADAAAKLPFECRPIYDILSGVAERLGIKEKFTEGRSQEEWMRFLYEETKKKNGNFPMPSFEEFRKQGIIKRKDPAGGMVAFSKFRENPEAAPLKTPSGKIEIYSERLAKIAASWELEKDETIDPLPIHCSTFEGWDDPMRSTYPLQFVTYHYKARTHSTYGNIDVLKAAARQEIWINPIDAEARGIKSGDMVRVFNARGETRLPAKVTPRIMPGVTAAGQGAWHMPDAEGIDQNGSVNVVTTQRPSPLAKGNPQHTNLVDVQKIA